VSSQGYDFVSAGALDVAACCQTGTVSEILKELGVNRDHRCNLYHQYSQQAIIFIMIDMTQKWAHCYGLRNISCLVLSFVCSFPLKVLIYKLLWAELARK
jgi:hypothetical protein